MYILAVGGRGRVDTGKRLSTHGSESLGLGIRTLFSHSVSSMDPFGPQHYSIRVVRVRDDLSGLRRA